MNIHTKHSRHKPLTNPVKWEPGNTEVTAHAAAVAITYLASLLNSGSTLNWTPFQRPCLPRTEAIKRCLSHHGTFFLSRQYSVCGL